MEEFIKEMWESENDYGVDELVCDVYKMQIKEIDWTTM